MQLKLLANAEYLGRLGSFKGFGFICLFCSFKNVCLGRLVSKF